MINCVSVENMRESDRRTMEGGVSSKLLMYRAAMGVFRTVKFTSGTVIAAGGGNNGGDGFALACILADNGIMPEVFTLSAHPSPDGEYFMALAGKKGVRIQPYIPGSGCFDGAAFIVDCLMGTGFSGSVKEPYLSAVKEINDSDAFTVSVDINSGMNGDTGEAQTAVCSDLTVTVGIIKRGLVTPAAGKYIKKLVCADIGIPPAEKEFFIPENKEEEKAVPEDKIIRTPFFSVPRIIDCTDVRNYIK